MVSQLAPSKEQEVVTEAYNDALDDVHTRFIVNLPPEELATSDRIFFQLEQAYWFYDDFICDNSKLPLPRFKSLKPFATKMFEISPILDKQLFDKMWEEFSLYKRRISTYGSILLNETCTKVILCQAWKGNSWTFPAGKINQNEVGTDAGARETYEETGFDPNCCFGITKEMKEASSEINCNINKTITWNPLREEDSLLVTDSDGKRRTMYLCRGVPEDYPFAPVARKEVSAVQWHAIDDVPKKSYAVLPFMKQLRRWIKKNKKKNNNNTPGKQRNNTPSRAGSRSRSSSNKKQSRSQNSSRSRVREDDPITETGLANPGDISGWSEKDMFAVNEKLVGRKITYDGNPHYFAEKGFNGDDPHAFRIIDGSFMNSAAGLGSVVADAPNQSCLQPLFSRKEKGDDNEQLLPFFSDQGATPWGEVVPEAKGENKLIERKGVDNNDRKDGGNKNNKYIEPLNSISKMIPPPDKIMTPEEAIIVTSNDLDTVFLTDSNITAKSQREKKLRQQKQEALKKMDQQTKNISGDTRRKANRKKYIQNLEYIQQWVANLNPTKTNKNDDIFSFDVDKIMNAMEIHLK